jgi:catechol 2,3-dioxygenase-like lactoylglutathione lyase family enzyme
MIPPPATRAERKLPPALASIAPFFIVRDIAPAIAFYRDRLAFRVAHASPEPEPFFAIVERDGVSIFLKAVGPDVPPLANAQRHAWARWDAFVSVAEPDALAAEFSSRGVAFREPLADTEDGLRGFAVSDADGYVLFFGRPRD